EVRLTLPQGRVGPVMGVMRDTVKVKLDSERFQQVSQRAIVYQGGFILAPGSYRLKFLARENESGRIGTFEQDLLIPMRQPERLELSTIMLSSQLETVKKTTEVEKKSFADGAKMARSPLEMGGERIIPSVTRVFTTQQKMYVFFQAYVPLEKFAPGRYTVQAVAVQTGGGHSAFARGYFALRPPVNGAATPTKAPGK
ncbi:MAG: hypothetical protein HY012_03710, partial [Acidobacteria bacterium]|nr:hypothetical protein [Acidobacteriota bacterium]